MNHTAIRLDTFARELIQNLDNRLSPSAYDTAWMARVRDDSGEKARWPDLVDWLLANQHEDGSWGGQIYYVHDRILSTLVALIALKENGIDEIHPEQIEEGEAFIWHNIHKLHTDLMELAGFEILLPTLIQDAHTLGLKVPAHSYGYGAIRDAKLSKIPMELMTSPKVSLSNAMEFWKGNDALNILEQVQGASGAIANSPSTTSYLAITSKSQNKAAIQWLQAVKDRPYGIPDFHPWTDFEISWTMQHLAYSGIPLTEFRDLPVWETLLQDLTPRGISIHPTYSIRDGDTTSVSIHVLRRAGFDVDPLILKTFEHPEKSHFLTFFFERNMSVITNVHALEALSLLPDYPDRDEVYDNVVRAILSQQKYQTFWIDKWHISPFYASAHTLIALMTIGEHHLLEYSNFITWLLHTQREDGSWGYFDRGTREETALAVLTLMHYHDLVQEINPDIIHRAMEYLEGAEEKNLPFEELYIGKVLYAPIDVIKALLFSAKYRYKNTIGG